MPNEPLTLRRVELASLSAGDELIAVVRAAMAIGVGTWLYLMSSPFMVPNDGSARRNLFPYQRLVQDRPSDEQRMFRELQVALLEAETARSTSGQWPDAPRLAAEGVEPFAPNPALKGPTYTWRLSRDGRFINYTGIATATATTVGAQPRPTSTVPPSWLILIQEPDPAAPEPFQDDEDHDRLTDGSLLHVSIWNRPEGGSFPTRVVRSPQAEGWVQLYAASPPATHAVIGSPPAP